MDVNWDVVTTDTSEILSALTPILSVAVPGLSVGLSLAGKIAQGVLAAEPVAVALFEQIKGGTQPTPQQLADYAANYEESYQQLNADILEKLAEIPE